MPKVSKLAFCFKRCEKKYLIDASQQERILSAISDHMVPDEYERYRLNNIYYDTENYALIRASIEKPVYKEKLRIRSYTVPGDGDSVFVELKKKFDDVVYKRRIVTTAELAPRYLAGEVPFPGGGQISREIDRFQSVYGSYPRVYIGYERLAFAGKDDPELRMTFDTDLRYRTHDLDLRLGDLGEPLISGDKILMEIKIPGVMPFWMAHLLSEVGAFGTSFSKYGMYYKSVVMKKKGEI